MSCKKIFITTPIYYVNDVAHIGHAYTTIISDSIARYSKLLGYDTFLLTGTDEHGQKIEQSAKKKNKTPKEYADEISKTFQDLWEVLNIDYDKFIRTTDEYHKIGVQFAFEKMFKNPALLQKNEVDIKFSPVKNFKHAEKLGAVAINFKEAPEAGKHYPVFFIQDADGIIPIALLGFEKNKNLFIDENGQWEKGRYIPRIITLYPFIFTKVKEQKDGNSVSIAYDKDFEGLNQKDGKKFFNSDSSLTEFGQSIMKYAEELFISIKQTQSITALLNELDLLHKVNITLGKEESDKYKIEGLFQVDTEKLNNLTDANLVKLAKSGALHLIYNHLDSLSNFENLSAKLQ